MDINLTGQILNMPINLTGQVTSPRAFWDSQLIGVIIGGLIAYLAAITTEELKRQSEMKKETYFTLIDVVFEAQNVLPKAIPFIKELEKEFKAHNVSSASDKVDYVADYFYPKWKAEPQIYQAIDNMNKWYASYNAIEFKIKVCGSKKISSEMEKWSNAITESLYNRYEMPPKSIEDELISAMRQDLDKHWWQFWK
jgi:hypothetical protein